MPSVKLLDNPAQIVSAAMNIGIRHASGEIIIRVDGHTIVAPDYVRQCVTLLRHTGADNVGGPMRAIGDNPLADVIALATSTPFGIGNSPFHYSEQEQAVDTVYMGAFRREALFRAGLYDETMIRHQDYDLNYRIRRNGGTIYLSPAIESHYYVRGSLKTLCKQYLEYGIWKGTFLRRYPQSVKVRHFVPPVFVFSLCVSMILSVGRRGRWLLGGLISVYGAFLSVASILTSRSASMRQKFRLAFVFACIHLSWGIGIWIGIVTPANRQTGR